jgi:hypothetical protein
MAYRIYLPGLRRFNRIREIRSGIVGVLCAGFVAGPCLAQGPVIPVSQRIAAARQTASMAADCLAVRPFYWEIGNDRIMLTGGQEGQNAPLRDTAMPIASSSKWIYAAYVAERRKGQLTADDIHFLTFQSGYTRFRVCLRSQTVANCMNSPLNGNGAIDPSTVDKFDYNGGHMQKHAMLMGLGDDTRLSLAARISQTLSGAMAEPAWAIAYGQAQLAGGGNISAAGYSVLLRALMDGRLQLGRWLGKDAVCTNPVVCPDQAVKTPVPASESWRYSIGHWVEDDPKVGDGAFSSPGAFGFYPWISADKQYYGILARDSKGSRASGGESQSWVQSVACGREIRAAWSTGQAR